MARKSNARLGRILETLASLYPEAACSLVHKDAFELLVATILSAQCTDERVNLTTPALFSRFPDAASLAAADRAEVERLIHSCGFYRNKAKNIQQAARLIVEQFGGRVPDTMDELLTLPGVARKTAAVVLGNWYHKLEGIAVDTHVFRLSHRLGLSKGKTPQHVERDLMASVPRPAWIDLNHRLIEHGRQICHARKPLCDLCSFAPDCPRIGVEPAASIPAQTRKP